jgi:hypothetical protein
MAFTSQKAAEAARSLEKAAEGVLEHGCPERAERLRTWGAFQLGNNLNQRGALFAELFAGLAEAVESLSARVEQLEAPPEAREEARPQRQVPSGGKKKKA